MENYLQKYNINLAEIKKHINQASVKKKVLDNRPVETYTPDVIDIYSQFAEKRMGIKFNDISLFITALTHRSFVNEHKKSIVEHNERLEFLGDAILELVVSDFLYKKFHEPEGIMTAWRSALFRTESIGAA